MPTPPKRKGPTTEEKQRVLDAYQRGDNWKLVAKHNGLSESTAWRVVDSGRTELKPRGGHRASQVKVTPDVVAALERYVNNNCQYTLAEMKAFVAADFAGKSVSMQTISRHLLGMVYTMKQVRIEPVTCNNVINKEKRRGFAAKLKQHQQDGDFIVYYDETNYNLYCKRSRGRSKRGTRASTVLPPSKGPNLQVQCAVSAELGLVCYRLERGSIKMDQNAAYVETIYQTVKMSAVWEEHFAGKRVVIVLDNAPAHSQTEERVVQHDDMTLLRLGPYSPMLNPIESCFSVLKSRIKGYLAHHTAYMFERGEYHTFLERRMVLLEDAAHESMPSITQSLVIREALFCQENVEKALRLENMVYGQ
ncbi:hypothetical protein DYB30_013053 [Aphanomyces astaci]|uniref:Tc1-like transposase DDE domain-containing protein n=1 Tax=Aphanomyces astaci TaxID=112090 RepID=A0A397E2X3_APHAT|nr:hypothetical protein DYB30_013053 [Aphanomyces astaci]RHY75540.1 hypothetical protein DYB38_007822 [Aphanomyces astaci]